MDSAGPRPSFAERHGGLLASLAVLHLVLVCVCVWTDLAEASGSPVHRGVRTYKNLSGVFRDYRFFAPAVASDMRAGFFLEQADGTTTFEAIIADNPELALRYHCIVASSMRNQNLRDLMARSWSAMALGNHPEAVRVTVVAQAYRLPMMVPYASGEQPRWDTVYAGTFDRRRAQRAQTASAEAAP